MARRPVKVTITYCAECGYERQTLALTEALLLACGHELSGVELIPWVEGSFEVVVGGERVHSMYRDGGFPEPANVVAAVHRIAGGEGLP
ncbi:MAG: Rdx family protein [Chloroflexi bacterium]|nr:Rdx family protein [Chloroflexota bacterium]